MSNDKKDLLIIGQGLAGTLFSFLCHKHQKSFDVIDKGHKNAASSVSSGLINPITGRRFKKVWKFETLKNYFLPLYEEMEDVLDISIIREIEILRALNTAEAKNYWDSRKTDPDYAKYMSDEQSKGQFEDITDDIVIGRTKGCYQIAINRLLKKWRSFLKSRDQLIEREFDLENFDPEEKLEIDGVTYDKVIFCSGAAARKSKLWEFVPFNLSKGEVLIDETQNFQGNEILKNKVFYVPRSDGSLWLGTANDWEFDDLETTEESREELLRKVRETSSLNPTVSDQRAAVRPTTKDRKPVIGPHYSYHNLFILNGFGTMGMSRGPYSATMLFQFAFYGKLMPDEMDVFRFYPEG